MSFDAVLRPFVGLGSISIRMSGASVGFVVNEHTVIEPVASNRSSWMITWTRLAGIVGPARQCPDFAAFHSSKSMLTESMKAWSSFSCRLLDTASD